MASAANSLRASWPLPRSTPLPESCALRPDVLRAVSVSPVPLSVAGPRRLIFGLPSRACLITFSCGRAAVKLKDSVELILKSKGSQVYSISADATVYEALETLAEKDVAALVLMNG